jgi:two-component system chemotaxis response regulator CheB
MTDPLRVLIVDDSATVRRVLRAMLESDPTITVVGEAANGREAIERVVELRPALVILDVRMPVMDGVETTRQIMAYHPTPILVVTASLSSYDIDITFQMLGAGALDLVEKPLLSDPGAVEKARLVLIRKAKLLSRVKVVTHLRGRRKELRAEHEELRNPAPPPPGLRSALFPIPNAPFSMPPSQFPVVVIGASTGGPRIVRQILAGLPADFGAAVVVVQHIAEGFSKGMVEWLAESIPLSVQLASENDQLMPGKVLVAPDRYDLLVKIGGRIHLSSQPLLLQRPAIDIAMQSAAEAFGPRTIGVLLTGMGRDGALGMQTIRRVGGYTIAQDKASCTIYGMPRAAIEQGAASAVLPPDQIIEALRERVH